MSDHDGSVVINPTGLLGKCEHYTHEEMFGSIYTEKKNLDLINSWKEPKPEVEHCKECFFLPLCKTLKKCPSKAHIVCNDDERRRWSMYLNESIKKCYDEWKDGKF